MTKLLFLLNILLSLSLLSACKSSSPQGAEHKSVTSGNNTSTTMSNEVLVFDGNKIQKTVEEWKAVLYPNQFNIIRNKGTESPFSSELLKNKKKGNYCCAACGLPLFASDTKFDSGTGWPSFYQPIHSKNVGELKDATHGMLRVEVVCNRCDGHLGHVFDDGPQPTGLRYCINGGALKFEGE